MILAQTIFMATTGATNGAGVLRDILVAVSMRSTLSCHVATFRRGLWWRTSTDISLRPALRLQMGSIV